jgi:hypothetical protein
MQNRVMDHGYGLVGMGMGYQHGSTYKQKLAV